MDLHDLHLPDNYREIANQFLAACQADERIVAAFVGGSYANGEIDKHSDLDLFFITTDEAYQDFLAEKERFIRQLDEPILLEDFGAPHGYCIIFSNGTEGDIWFGHESQFNDFYSGPYKVLFDKKNLLNGDAFPPHIADQTEQRELLRRQINWFWHELGHFIKAMGRKQLWFAYGQIESMRRMCVILARLKHNFSDAFLEESEPYFKIEQALPAEEISSLQTTFCALEYDGILEAAQVIFRFYLDTAPGLAKAHNLPYHVELEQIMMRNLQDLCNASKS